MDAPEVVEVAHDPPVIETLALSPDARATLVINLIAEIAITGIALLSHIPPRSYMPKHSSDWLQPPSGHAQRPPKPEWSKLSTNEEMISREV